MCLNGQSGNTWLVDLASDTEGLFFRQGWKEFVIDNSIESGHLLTFCYDGHSQFFVVVFDEKCIKKPSSFHAKPCKDLAIAIESGEENKELPPTPQEQNNIATKKRTRELGANGSRLENHYNESFKDKKKIASSFGWYL